jgi:hypothetical protein
MKTFIAFGLLCCALFLCGCSQNLARFSLVSTGNVPLAGVEDGEYVVGKDCIRRILFFTFGNRNDRITGAVVNALERADKKEFPSDALTNASISHSSANFLLFSWDCYEAKGKAISVKN